MAESKRVSYFTVENYRDSQRPLNQKFHLRWRHGNGSQRDFYAAKGAQPQIVPGIIPREKTAS